MLSITVKISYLAEFIEEKTFNFALKKDITDQHKNSIFLIKALNKISTWYPAKSVITIVSICYGEAPVIFKSLD